MIEPIPQGADRLRRIGAVLPPRGRLVLGHERRCIIVG
jgi:hypothetical protein